MTETAVALPVLYSFRRCPYAMRARLALAIGGVSCEHREVVLKNKPAELLTASPKGTVPVLVLANGQVIDESLDVMLWALKERDPQLWLAPQRGSVADMLALIASNDLGFKYQLDRYKYPHRFTTVLPANSGELALLALAHRTAAANWLLTLEVLLNEGWLCGSRASLADFAILPFVRQFAHTDKFWFATQPWPALQAWLHAFEHSSLYQDVMQKHEPWLGTEV